MADRDVRFLLLHVEDRGEDGAFRRAVAVVEGVGRRVHGHELLAAHGQMLQGRISGIVQGEHHAHLCGHEAVRDAVVGDEAVQFRHVVPGILRNDVHGGARRQGGIHVHHAGVETVAGVGRHPAFRGEAVIVPVPGAEVHQVAVLQHAALRDAGGAGRVQEDEQVLRSGTFRDGARGQRGDIRGVQDRASIGSDQGPVLRIGNEQFRRSVPDHEVQAPLGIGRIQRLVGATGLEGAEGGHGHVLAAADQDGDDVFPSEAQRSNVRGDPVGHLIQFLVCQRLASIAHRRGVRPLGGLGPEQGHDRLRGIHREGIGIETVQELLLFLVDERDAVHRTVLEHSPQHLRHRAGEALHEFLAVQGLVVLDEDAFGRFPAVDEDAHREHRWRGPRR